MNVSFLDRVFSAPGPYATVCADVTHTTESADTELDLRVRALTEQLSAQGAPGPVVEAVRERLTEGNEGGEAGTLRGRAVVVAGNGTVVLDQPLVDTPRTETAEWSDTPDLLSVLGKVPGRVPHIVVVADRVGADITVASLPGKPEHEEQVDGTRFLMRKVAGGGWAHHRYQHTAENVWVQNMDGVIRELDDVIGATTPAFILVAGDQRARQVFTDRATPAMRPLLVSIDEGGRADGADRGPIAAREVELVAEQEAAQIRTAVERVEAASAHGLSVTGVPAVVEALRKGQVETLVIADRTDDEQLLIGVDPMVLGVDQADLDALGVPDARSVPAEHALLRAAAGSDAEVVVVPRSAMPGDIPVAAVLRFTDPSTPQPQRIA